MHLQTAVGNCCKCGGAVFVKPFIESGNWGYSFKCDYCENCIDIYDDKHDDAVMKYNAIGGILEKVITV